MFFWIIVMIVLIAFLSLFEYFVIISLTRDIKKANASIKDDMYEIRNSIGVVEKKVNKVIKDSTEVCGLKKGDMVKHKISSSKYMVIDVAPYVCDYSYTGNKDIRRENEVLVSSGDEERLFIADELEKI